MRKSKPIMALGALTTGLTLAITGCGSSPTNATNVTNATAPPTSQQTPQSGGTVDYALPTQTNINWYMPIVNSGYDSLYNFQLIDMLYKPLLWVNNQYKIDWNSSVASKVTYNSAGTVYHVFLNPKWHWSDGTPVTTKDILFTWKVIQAASAPNAPSPWPYVGAGTGDIPNGVQSIVATGTYEFTVTLKKPANQQWFMYNGISQLTPLPAQAWDKYKNMTQELTYLGKNATNPSFDTVVDGSFQLQSAKSSQSWTLVPNKTYDGHKSLLKKFVFVYEGSNAAEFAGMKTGANNVGYLDLSQYGSRGSLTSQGDVISPGYGFGFFDAELNMLPGNPLGATFKQLYVRQALEMGIDQPQMNTSLNHGYAPPQYGPVPTVPKTQFLDPRLQQPLYPFNPQKGKQLLEAHGWKMVNGVMTKGSQQLKFTLIYSGGSNLNTQTVELIKEDWAKEGVDVTLKPLPFATLEGEISNPKDAGSWGVAADQGIIYAGTYPTGGQLFEPGGLDNFGYSDPKENALIAATHQPYATAAQSNQAYDNYEYYTAQQLPVLWMNNNGSLSVHASTVHQSVKYGNPLTGISQFNYWWISP